METVFVIDPYFTCIFNWILPSMWIVHTFYINIQLNMETKGRPREVKEMEKQKRQQQSKIGYSRVTYAS